MARSEISRALPGSGPRTPAELARNVKSISDRVELLETAPPEEEPEDWRHNPRGSKVLKSYGEAATGFNPFEFVILHTLT